MASAQPEIIANAALPTTATGGVTGTVAEPSIANNSTQIFTTGNWYASVSPNDGATWQLISPFTFPPPTPAGFCCDQTVIYDQSRNLTIWLLQYGREPATPTMPGSNVLRVAVQQAAGGPWVWWDLRPFQVNPAWANEWFDFNHAALSGSSLYVGSNVFSVFGNPNPWTRSVVFRIGLDGLAATPPSLTFSYFQSTDASMICTQGATDTMYMADLVGTSTLRVYTWSEVTNLVTQTDVTVAPTVFSQVGLFGNTNDGRNWLQRCDNRLTGAWVAQGILGFMWASDRMTGRPFAFTRVVRINAVSKAVIDQPDIWHNSVAYAYANASTNNAGDVGISLWRGGGLQHPGHVIGVWDNFNNVWSLMATRDSTHSPNDNKWGDYTTVRRHSPDAATWIAAAHTLQGGDGPTAVEPRFVHFRKKVV